MTGSRPLAAVLTSLILASCSDVPAAPRELELPPAFARGGGAEVNAHDEITVPLDHTMFIECAGEDVRFTGNVVFRLHQTTTPSGVFVQHVTIPASAAGTSLRATGQASGTVWVLASGASVQTIVRKDGTTRVVNVARNEAYVAEDGSTLRLHHLLHLTMVDGEPARVERQEWTCR